MVDTTIEKEDYYLDFDGIDDYVEVPDDSSLDVDEITLACWVKKDNRNRSRFIDKFDNNVNYGYLLEDRGDGLNNEIGFDIYTTGGNRNLLVYILDDIVDEWVFLVGTYDGSDLRLYVNGDLKETKTGSGDPIRVNSQNLLLGDSPLGDTKLNGSMDDARIYDRALSDSEVQDLYEGRDITKGLVSFWDFSEGEGDTLYDSWGTNDGTIYGADWNDYYWYALDFDGSDDYVDVSDDASLQLTNNFTVSIWAYIDSVSDWTQGDKGQFIGWGGGVDNWIVYHWESIFLFRYKDTNGDTQTLSANKDLVAKKWMHLVAVYSDGDVSFYIDGEFINQATRSKNMKTDAWSNMLIGDGYDYLEGRLDNIRVFNKALSDSEVQDLYEGEHISDGLVSHWEMSQGEGSTAYDYAGSNDGTIYGATWQEYYQDDPDAWEEIRYADWSVERGIGKNLLAPMGDLLTFKDEYIQPFKLVRFKDENDNVFFKGRTKSKGNIDSQGLRELQIRGLGYEVLEENEFGTLEGRTLNDLLLNREFPYGLDGYETSDTDAYWDHFWKPDGTKLYLLSGGNLGASSSDKIIEYNLSSPFDPSSATYNQDTGLTNAPSTMSIYFKPDGTKYYILRQAQQELVSYNLSTAWDISTKTENNIYDLTNLDNIADSSEGSTGAYEYPRGLEFFESGNKVLMFDPGNNEEFVVELSTAWDISTINSTPTQQVTLDSEYYTSGEGVTDVEKNTIFGKDGYKVYQSDARDDNYNNHQPHIIEYELNVPYDLSTASLLDRYYFGGDEENIRGIRLTTESYNEHKLFACRGEGLSTTDEYRSFDEFFMIYDSIKETIIDSFENQETGTKPDDCDLLTGTTDDIYISDLQSYHKYNSIKAENNDHELKTDTIDIIPTQLSFAHYWMNLDTSSTNPSRYIIYEDSENSNEIINIELTYDTTNDKKIIDINGNTYDYTANLKEWYDIKIKNIDFDDNNFDVEILDTDSNSILSKTDISFKNTASKIDRITSKLVDAGSHIDYIDNLTYRSYETTEEYTFENTSPEYILQGIFSNSDLDVIVPEKTDIVLPEFKIDNNKKKNVVRDLMERTGYNARIDDNTLYFEPKQYKDNYSTIDTSTDKANLQKFEKGDIDTVINKTRVIGSGQRNNKVKGFAKDTNSIRRYGGRFKEYNYNYIKTKQEAEDLAEKLLIPDPLVKGKMVLAGGKYTKDNICNYGLDIIDESKNVNTTQTEPLTIERQILKEGRMILELGEGSSFGISERNKENKSDRYKNTGSADQTSENQEEIKIQNLGDKHHDKLDGIVSDNHHSKTTSHTELNDVNTDNHHSKTTSHTELNDVNTDNHHSKTIKTTSYSDLNDFNVVKTGSISLNSGNTQEVQIKNVNHIFVVIKMDDHSNVSGEGILYYIKPQYVDGTSQYQELVFENTANESINFSYKAIEVT